MAQDVVKLNLRLPRKLHKEMQRRARKSGLSLNRQIVRELEERDWAQKMVEVMLSVAIDQVLKTSAARKAVREAVAAAEEEAKKEPPK